MNKRGRESLNIELKTERKMEKYEKRKEATVCYIWERGERQERTIHPFLLLEAKKRTGRQPCTPGLLRHLIGDEEKQAKSQFQTEWL